MNLLGLYFPTGVNPGEILDPAKLTAELQEAARQAARRGQQGWVRDAFTLDLFSPDCVQLEAKEVASPSNVLVGGATRPILPDRAGFDVNQWKLPYNAGMVAVGSGLASGEMTVTWTSEVVELVLLIGTCQYSRTVGGAQITRAQMGLALDGVAVEGAVVAAEPPYGHVRGSGAHQVDLAYCAVAPLLVLPGEHQLSLVAGQALATPVDLADGTELGDSMEYAIEEQVCIGNRAVYAVRIAMGGSL